MMHGIKIPVGTAVPEVNVIKMNQTITKINAFEKRISLRSDIKDLITFA
jgi:hypothetical protein